MKGFLTNSSSSFPFFSFPISSYSLLFLIVKTNPLSVYSHLLLLCCLHKIHLNLSIWKDMHVVMEEKTNEKKMFFFRKLDVGLKKKRGRDFLVFIYKNVITESMCYFFIFYRNINTFAKLYRILIVLKSFKISSKSKTKNKGNYTLK